jgi:hypothetical protein
MGKWVLENERTKRERKGEEWESKGGGWRAWRGGGSYGTASEPQPYEGVAAYV